MDVVLQSPNQIDLSNLITQIKRMGFFLDSSLVSFRSPKQDIFIYCGSDPLPQHTTLSINEVDNMNRLQLRFKPGLKSDGVFNLEGQTNSESSNLIAKRTKERKIGFIIERVSLWRKLYNGIPDGRGNIIRYSLQEAAQKVGISKKSLDDYLLQLRFGRKYGFDFNNNKETKVGILRAFVKKEKAKQTSRQKKS